MVSVLVMVAITPLVGVYIFSVEFINRGIDNWLNVDVEKGLERRARARPNGARHPDARPARRGAIDFAQQLADVTGDELATKLNALRAGSDAIEVTVYGQNRILGFTSVDLDPGATRYPTDEVLLQLRQQGQYVSVEPQPDGDYQILAAAAFTLPTANDELGFVQAKFPMEQRFSTLANAVQGSYNQVEELHVSAHGAEVQLHADVEPRAPDLAAGVRLRRVLLLAAPGHADPTVDAGYASRRARRLCDARADAGARRDRLPRAFVQRHDAAARARQRGRAAESAAGRARAAQARGDPRASIDGRRLARARSANSDGQSRGERDSRRQSRDARRRVDRQARRERAAARAVRRRGAERICKAATASGASKSCCVPRAAGAF